MRVDGRGCGALHPRAGVGHIFNVFWFVEDVLCFLCNIVCDFRADISIPR